MQELCLISSIGDLIYNKDGLNHCGLRHGVRLKDDIGIVRFDLFFATAGGIISEKINLITWSGNGFME